MTAWKKGILCLGGGLALAALPALARDDAARSKEYARCMDQSGGVDPAMLQCASDEHARQDKRLNAAYRKLMNALNAQRKTQLQEAQRLWLKYTEANCSFYYDPDGGTLARLASSECAVSARAARADELEGLLKDNR